MAEDAERILHSGVSRKIFMPHLKNRGIPISLASESHCSSLDPRGYTFCLEDWSCKQYHL